MRRGEGVVERVICVEKGGQVAVVVEIGVVDSEVFLDIAYKEGVPPLPRLFRAI